VAACDLSASLKALLENDARPVPQPLRDLRSDRLAIGATLNSRDKMTTSDARPSLACRFHAQPILSPEIPNRLAALIGPPWLAWPVRVSPGALPQDPHNPPPNQRLDLRIVVVPRRPHLNLAVRIDDDPRALPIRSVDPVHKRDCPHGRFMNEHAAHSTALARSMTSSTSASMAS